MKNARQPAVAGLFYPNNAKDLSTDVKRFLHTARKTLPDDEAPKALIVPHAGYIYSGAVAAAGYAALSSNADQIHRVVLLGPAHRTYFHDLATTTMDYFRTPLGDVPIDKAAIEQLLNLPGMQAMESAHQQEHSLEVQLPFLQMALGNFSLIPIAVGDASGAQVQQVLDLLWGGPETLIVISSDLSHYQNYRSAQAIDQSTCQTIEQIDLTPVNSQQACGCIGINGLLLAARQRNMKVRTLDLRNSGDVTGERETVVGYGSWAFMEN
jgi:MEMO1 family protein